MTPISELDHDAIRLDAEELTRRLGALASGGKLQSAVVVFGVLIVLCVV